MDKDIAWSRRFAYGAVQLCINLAARVPSQHLRRWSLRRFGLTLGAGSVIYGGAELRSPWRIKIGNWVSVGSRACLDGRGGLEIHDCVNISSEVMLWTAQHDHQSQDFRSTLGKIILEDYVWVGPRAIILPGVNIRRGCVIAAAAVVTHDTQPFGIYAGIPAKRIGERTRELEYKPGRNYTPIL